MLHRAEHASALLGWAAPCLDQIAHPLEVRSPWPASA
jgi:hypothetical protein